MSATMKISAKKIRDALTHTVAMNVMHRSLVKLDTQNQAEAPGECRDFSTTWLSWITPSEAAAASCCLEFSLLCEKVFDWKKKFMLSLLVVVIVDCLHSALVEILQTGKASYIKIKCM